MVGYLTPFFAVAFVIWAGSYARRRARISGEAQILEYGLPHKLLAWSATLILLYLVIHGFRGDASDRLFLGFGLFPILVPVSLITLHVSLAQIRFSRESIEVSSPWRRQRVIPFSKVRDVRAGIAGWTVQTEGHGSIRFNHLQRGWRQFRKSLQEKDPGANV